MPCSREKIIEFCASNKHTLVMGSMESVIMECMGLMFHNHNEKVHYFPYLRITMTNVIDNIIDEITLPSSSNLEGP